MSDINDPLLFTLPKAVEMALKPWVDKSDCALEQASLSILATIENWHRCNKNAPKKRREDLRAAAEQARDAMRHMQQKFLSTKVKPRKDK